MYSNFTRQIQNSSNSFDFVAAHFRCERDKYSAAENADGYVNFGSAQNFVCGPEIAERLGAIPWHPEDMAYREFAGTDECRAAIARQMSIHSTAQVDPQNLVVSNGVISVLEAISIAVLNPGEKVLVPTPVFPGLVTALTLRTGAEFITFDTRPEDGFQLSSEQLRDELRSLETENVQIKALLLCSPGNPIGHVFDAEELKRFVEIAQEFGFLLIVDEIYASSCFDEVEFVSSVSFDSPNVATIGGLSKDFGVAGFATGWLHSTNETIMTAVRKQSHFFRLPAPVQRAIEFFLDPEWSQTFSATNRKRLTESYTRAVQSIREIGVDVVPAEAGLVLWLDLRSFLKTPGEAGQLELYRYLLDENRVHLSPACGFHYPEPGFFRICFSQQENTLLEGLGRIQKGLHDFKKLPNNLAIEV